MTTISLKDTLELEMVVANAQPNIATSENKTDKTDKTELTSVSNNDFMNAIFGDIKDSDRPVIVSFSGNPATVEKSSWKCHPWNPNTRQFPEYNNNYTSFATYKPDEDNGEYNRKKKNFVALYAVMLDDIGTKVPLNKIKLKPSWAIETSSENYQMGFILEVSIADTSEADNLLKAIIDAGLTDPGANGPCSRLGRLPVAQNGKHYDEYMLEWQCKLTEWNPDYRYTAQQLLDGLGVKPANAAPTVTVKSVPSTNIATPHVEDDVHIPRANQHPVISALIAAGLYKQPLGNGKHDITCPWVHEHTDQIDNGTAYWEPSEFYPIGGFKCLHGHCAERRVKEIHELFSISKTEAKHKPIIRAQAGELTLICNVAEAELAKTSRYYQRSGVIVTVKTDSSIHETTVCPLSYSALSLAMAGLVTWQKYDMRSKEWRVSDPYDKAVRILHDMTDYTLLPILNGIARQPYLRTNDSLMMEAGYDLSSGMFGVFNSAQFNVPESPTREQAEDALTELSALLSEFAFKDEQDKSAVLAGILTAIIRPSLPLAPMFHVKAPSIASGKSYLCELLTAFASPQRGTPHSFPTSDDECQKMLLSELLTAPAVIEFDNLTGDIVPYKTLCTVLTSEHISGRILGKSAIAKVSSRTLLLSSGNNVGPIKDMIRRVITINLDPACETPATRNFVKQPVNDVIANRGHYVSFGLTIIRAWLVAEKPQSTCKSIASYTNWSNYCRQPLLWLDLSDPAECMFAAMNDDPDRAVLGNLLQEWFIAFGSSSVSIKGVVKVAKDRTPGNSKLNNEPLYDAIIDIAGDSRTGEINNKRLGWWVKSHAGQVVNGSRFVQDKSVTTNVAKWKVESVS